MVIFLFLVTTCSATPQATATATAGNFPAIGSMKLDQTAGLRCESLEMTAARDAKYPNPFEPGIQLD